MPSDRRSDDKPNQKLPLLESDEKKLRSQVRGWLLAEKTVATFGNILKSLNSSKEHQEDRLRVIQAGLRVLHSGDVDSLSVSSSSAVCVICMELDRISNDQITMMVDVCLECLGSGGAVGNWGEVLSKCLWMLNSLNHVTYQGEDMTGKEAKKEAVAAICHLPWKPELATSIVASFKDIPLGSEEVDRVVKKSCVYLADLPPKEVPSLTSQLILLCMNEPCMRIVVTLDEYFKQDKYDKAEMEECQSMVLYHFVENSSVGHPFVKELLKDIKQGLAWPPLLLSPFPFALLLALAGVPRLEEQIVEVLRQCLMRDIHDTQHRKEIAWFAQHNIKANGILDLLKEKSPNEMDALLQGLIPLSMALLDVPCTPKNATIARKAWDLGTNLILSIVSTQIDSTQTIMHALEGRVLSSNNVTPYTDCLWRMCNKLWATSPSSVPHTLKDLLCQVGLLPLRKASLLLHSVVPLLPQCPPVLDTLMMALRKALFLREEDAKSVAIVGFVLLLSHSGNVGGVPESQCTQGPGHFTISDFPETSHSESLRMEVVSMLRKILNQGGEVKRLLYEGLCMAVHKNKELPQVLLSSLFFPQFTNYYDVEQDQPVKLDKAVVIKDSKAFVVEPVGYLLLLVSQLCKRAGDGLTERMTDMMDTLVTKMAAMNVDELDLVSEDDVETTEGERHKLQCIEMLQVFEALIVHSLNKRTARNEVAQKMVALFNNYQGVVEIMGYAGKVKKDKAQNKKKGRSPSHSSVDSILPLKFIHSFLDALYNPEQRNSQATMTSARRSVPLQTHVVKSLKSHVSRQHTSHWDPLTSDSHLKLYSHCAQLLLTMVDKEVDLGPKEGHWGLLVLSMETVSLLTPMAMHLNGDRPAFFMAVLDGSDPGDGTDLSMSAVSCGEKLLTMLEKCLSCAEDERSGDENEENETHMNKSQWQLVTQITLSLKTVLAEVTQDSSARPKLQKFHDRIKVICVTKNLSDRSTCGCVIDLYFTVCLQYKSHSASLQSVARHIHKMMGDLDKTLKFGDVSTYNSVTETTLDVCLQKLLHHQTVYLDMVEATVAAVSSRVLSSLGESDSNEVVAVERDICAQLGMSIKTTLELLQTKVPRGITSDSLLRVTSHLFNAMGTLAKYFNDIISRRKGNFQGSKFESVVKMAGSDLKPKVEAFVSYVYNAKNGQLDGTQKKGAKKNDFQRSKFVPSLVFAMEEYEKKLIIVSKKSKINLLEGTRNSTSRDFRICVAELTQTVPTQDTVNSTAASTSSTSENTPSPSGNPANESGQTGKSTGNKRKAETQQKSGKKKKK